jgi:PadR family transcriptional regulator, regulatory protein AphA
MTSEALTEETEPEPLLQGMAAEHALLGLLALSVEGVGHGYELARHFEAGAPLGNVIRLEPGMVYHHLKKLDRLEWVAALADEQGRAARRTFAISDAGRMELARWLAEPVAHTREIRLEFLVKLYFAGLLDPAITARLVREQREICLRMIESFTEQLRSEQAAEISDTPARQFGDMVLELRLAQTRAALTWLDSIQPGSPVATIDDTKRR